LKGRIPQRLVRGLPAAFPAVNRRSSGVIESEKIQIRHAKKLLNADAVRAEKSANPGRKGVA
jgi:hypothetical protein